MVQNLDATETTRGVIDRFNEAFNQHDVDGIMALMTEDCVFENTSPVPDGSRHVGQSASRPITSPMTIRS